MDQHYDDYHWSDNVQGKWNIRLFSYRLLQKKMHAIFTGHELSDKVIKFETDRGHNICKYHLTATQKDEADRRLQEIHTCACITMVFGFADGTFKVVPTIFSSSGPFMPCTKVTLFLSCMPYLPPRPRFRVESQTHVQESSLL